MTATHTIVNRWESHMFPLLRSCCDACSDFYRYTFGGGLTLFAILAGLLLLSTRLTGEVFGTGGSGQQYEENDKRELKLQEVVENPSSNT